MYRLKVVAGAQAGVSYRLREGEVTIGRQEGNVIVLPSSQISKQHCRLVVEGGQVTLFDNGSRNGTFVNGSQTQAKLLNLGDRIELGDNVLVLKEYSIAPTATQLPEAIERPSGLEPAVDPASPQDLAGDFGAEQLPSVDNSGIPFDPELDDESLEDRPPQDLIGKAKWGFEKFVMPIFYGLLLRYQWRTVALGVVAVAIVINMILSVTPLIDANQYTIQRESGLRARFMARRLADINGPFLASGNKTKARLENFDREAGIQLVAITDLNNRIIAPTQRMDDVLASGPAAKVAVQMGQAYAQGTSDAGVVQVAGEHIVVAIEPIKVLDTQLAKNVVIGMSIVSVDTRVSSPNVGTIGVAYSKTLIVTTIITLLAVLIIYRLTLKPFEILNEDIDKVLKGDLNQVTQEFNFNEMQPLWEIIGSSLQRIPRNSDGGDSQEFGANDPAASAEHFVNALRTMGEASEFGLIVIDHSGEVRYLNPSFEDVSGISAIDALGQTLGEVARDDSFPAMVADMIEQSDSLGGQEVNESFEFGGMNYKLTLGVFESGDQKLFYITAQQEVGEEY